VKATILRASLFSRLQGGEDGARFAAA